MKKFTSIAIAFLLVLSVIPAIAGDQTASNKESVRSQDVDKGLLTFQVFSELSVTEHKALTSLTETPLAYIGGCNSSWIGFDKV